MAAPPNANAPYKKDIVHNLGYKPLVRAFANITSPYINGWRQLPISYFISIGGIIYNKNITYEHIDDNTVRFYGPQNTQIVVQLFLEPREDAWYE